MDVHITGTLKINTENPDVLLLAIEPENATFPNESGKIESNINKNEVVTKLDGNMSIPRFISTIDDVFKTALLSLNILTEIED